MSWHHLSGMGTGCSYLHYAEHLPYFCSCGHVLPAVAGCRYHQASLSQGSTLLLCLHRPAPLCFPTFPAGQGRWTLVLCGAVGFLMPPLIPFILHSCLGQHHWLRLLQCVAACSEPQPAPRPQELLQSLPTWRCGPTSSDKVPQGSPELSVSV